MSTIRDVAKKADVSIATVSAVINDTDVSVRDSTKDRVLKAVKELNYRPNRIAQALSNNKSHTIGYIVPTITNLFFPELAKQVEDLAFSKGYSVYLGNTEGKIERAKHYMNSLIENHVAGIAVTLTWEIEKSNFIDNILNNNIPIVGLGGVRLRSDIDYVITDDFNGSRIATEHLINKGHTNIGFIGTKNSNTTSGRLKGYKSVLKDNGIKVNQSFIKLGETFSKEESMELVYDLLKRNSEISAIFAINDIMGSGAIQGIYRLKKRVPEDVAVIGFDDTVASYTYPQMTTMCIPKDQMAQVIMNTLFKKIDGKNSNPRHEKVLPKLIERNST